MSTRYLVASALAAAAAVPAMASAQKPVPTPKEFKAEKCYGIARAGANDCASTGNNSSGGTSKVMPIPMPGSMFPRATASGSSATA